jgi:hypothetical protein
MTTSGRKDLPADPFAALPSPRTPRRDLPLPTGRATQPQQRARAHVHSLSATQSINSATPTVVSFNTVDFDITGLFASNRFTIPSLGKVTGSWQIHGHAQFVKAAGGTVRELTIRKNGATTVAYSVVEPNTLDSLDVVLLINDPTPGDFYELVVNQDSGGALNLTTTPEKAYFEIIHLW